MTEATMLIVPDDFRNDWRGYVVNQFGHAALGVLMVFAISTSWVWVAGEYPHKEAIALIVLVAYLGVIELAVQGWRGWDTLEDTAFTGYGVAMPLLAFSEAQPGILTGSILDAAGIFFMGFFHLMAGAIWRARQSNDSAGLFGPGIGGAGRGDTGGGHSGAGNRVLAKEQRVPPDPKGVDAAGTGGFQGNVGGRAGNGAGDAGNQPKTVSRKDMRLVQLGTDAAYHAHRDTRKRLLEMTISGVLRHD
jgi:hypothetical protein